VLDWRKLVLIKYDRKINDVDTRGPFKHPIWSALMWMVYNLVENHFSS